MAREVYGTGAVGRTQRSNPACESKAVEVRQESRTDVGCVKSREPQVLEYLAYLKQSVDALNGALSELQGKIAPVLRQESEPCEKKECVEEGLSTPLANIIRGILYQTDRARLTVSDLLNRTEV